MSEAETPDQIKLMKRDLQRMRLAIIVIAAFFVYEAIGPLSFREARIEVQETVKVKELIVVNDFGETVAYLGSDNRSSGLILDDEAGNRIKIKPDAISLMASQKTNLIDRLRIRIDGVSAYDTNGQLIGVFPGG